MPTARTNRLIALIERDRRRLELIGIRAAQRIGLQARLHAVAALRTGHDPRQAVRDVLLGNAGLDYCSARDRFKACSRRIRPRPCA
jgi:hypothetical protein